MAKAGLTLAETGSITGNAANIVRGPLNVSLKFYALNNKLCLISVRTW